MAFYFEFLRIKQIYDNDKELNGFFNFCGWELVNIKKVKVYFWELSAEIEAKINICFVIAIAMLVLINIMLLAEIIMIIINTREKIKNIIIMSGGVLIIVLT